MLVNLLRSWLSSKHILVRGSDWQAGRGCDAVSSKDANSAFILGKHGNAIAASAAGKQPSTGREPRTANHQEAIGRFSRHARTKAVPPPNPLEEREARELIRKLLREWIQKLLGRTPLIDA